MALSNAERQRRYRERIKALLRNELSAPSLRNDGVTGDPVAMLLAAWEGADKETRRVFLSRVDVSDWYVLKHWFEDAAYELHRAKGTPVPEALALKKQHLVT